MWTLCGTYTTHAHTHTHSSADAFETLGSNILVSQLCKPQTSPSLYLRRLEMESDKLLESSELHKSSILEALEKNIERLKKNTSAGGLENVEVEARLGTFVDGTFISGVSKRYYDEMRHFLLTFYRSRSSNAKCTFEEQKLVDVIYPNDVRVTVNEETGKVLFDQISKTYEGVIIKQKENGIHNLDYDVRDHYSLRIGMARESLYEQKTSRKKAENFVRVTENFFVDSDRTKRILEGARLSIRPGEFIMLKVNPNIPEDDQLMKYAKQNGMKLPSEMANQVQWMILDFQAATSLDRRVLQYHDGKKNTSGIYDILALAGEVHIPGFGMYAIPTAVLKATVHIDHMCTLSKYPNFAIDQSNPDLQPKSFRRKIRTKFVVHQGNATQVVDMSITRFSEQGLENLDHCRPIYEIELDYNGRGNHTEFVRGIQALLYSTAPRVSAYKKKQKKAAGGVKKTGGRGAKRLRKEVS